MAGQSVNQIAESDDEVKKVYYSAIAENLLLYYSKSQTREWMEASMIGYAQDVARYSGYEVLDDWEANQIAKQELVGLTTKAQELKRRVEFRNPCGFRVNRRPLVNNLIPHISYATYATRIFTPEFNKPARNARILCGRVTSFVENLKEMTNINNQMLIQRAVNLERIPIDNEDDYKFAIEAKIAGFTGSLILTNQLNVTQSEEIEQDAVERGFEVIVPYTLRQKRMRLE